MITEWPEGQEDFSNFLLHRMGLETKMTYRNPYLYQPNSQTPFNQSPQIPLSNMQVTHNIPATRNQQMPTNKEPINMQLTPYHVKWSIKLPTIQI